MKISINGDINALSPLVSSFISFLKEPLFLLLLGAVIFSYGIIKILMVSRENVLSPPQNSINGSYFKFAGNDCQINGFTFTYPV